MRRFPDAPGEWSTGPAVALADGETLTVGGAEVTGCSPADTCRSRPRAT
jgi:hypothetical protein